MRTVKQYVLALILPLVFATVTLAEGSPKARIPQENLSTRQSSGVADATAAPGALLLVGSGLLVFGGILRRRREQ
jgi:hypothetical protein